MDADPFDALGCKPTFDLDEALVRRRWLERSLGVHPDRSRGDAPEDHARAALLNEAKRVLSDPEARADALLVRLGGPRRDEEKGLPAGFLMEIMELREELEAAQASADPAALAVCRGRAGEEREAWIERTREGFAGLGDEPEDAALRELRVGLNAWRYIERMLEQIDPPGAL